MEALSFHTLTSQNNLHFDFTDAEHQSHTNTPWWKFNASLECLSPIEAQELLGFILQGYGTVTIGLDLVIGKARNVSYVIRPTKRGRFNWSEEHCIDDMIIDTYVSGRKIKESRFVLNTISNIDQIIMAVMI